MPPATVVARGLSKSYGNGRTAAPVFRGVSLSAQPGEVVLLVGPSGSGKTTLLSILGCLLTPDAGTLEVLGVDVGRLGSEQRAAFRLAHLGFVFQTFNLFPTLSALDNVRLAAALRGGRLRQATERAGELLEQVGLFGRRHLRPGQLSNGESQRVAVARALAGDPALLLADEPTAALDAANGQAVLGLLQGLARQRGLTLVIVTHDPRIYPFADRVLALEAGTLREQPAPAFANGRPGGREVRA